MVIKNLTEIDDKNVVLLMGNFDGFHRGHVDLIEQLKKFAISKKCETCLVSFWPHPNFIFNPSNSNYLINSREEKHQYAQKLVDYYYEIPFTRDFSTLTPDAFLENYLIKKNVKGILVGYDFGFGTGKSGGFEDIKKLCEAHKIEVIKGVEFKYDQDSVSSSIIRGLIRDGELVKANKYLGRSFELEGVVIKGAGRGKTIGFPTANIKVNKDLLIPGRGVYVSTVNINNMNFNSITNIGFNPTFTDSHDVNVETNIFDFDKDIYGEIIKVSFYKKIRDEIKFASANELIDQIRKDCIEAKEYFGT